MYALTVSYSSSSCTSCLTPDEVYQVIDSYLNFEENSLSELAKDGIRVTLKAPTCGHYKIVDDICVTFVNGKWAAMHESIVSELAAMSDAAEQYYQASLNEDKIDSDIADYEGGFSSTEELVKCRKFTIEQIRGVC